MKDVTLGFKVSNEFKEQISKLIQESNLTGKEFIVHITNLYIEEQLKLNIPQISKNINEFKNTIITLLTIYISTCSEYLNYDNELDKKYLETIHNYENQLNSIEKEFALIKNENEAIKFTNSKYQNTIENLQIAYENLLKATSNYHPQPIEYNQSEIYKEAYEEICTTGDQISLSKTKKLFIDICNKYDSTIDNIKSDHFNTVKALNNKIQNLEKQLISYRLEIYKNEK